MPEAARRASALRFDAYALLHVRFELKPELNPAEKLNRPPLVTLPLHPAAPLIAQGEELSAAAHSCLRLNCALAL